MQFRGPCSKGRKAAGGKSVREGFGSEVEVEVEVEVEEGVLGTGMKRSGRNLLGEGKMAGSWLRE